jgi:hypothetical protein
MRMMGKLYCISATNERTLHLALSPPPYIAPRNGGEEAEEVEEGDEYGEEEDEDEEEARRVEAEREARWALPAYGEDVDGE